MQLPNRYTKVNKKKDWAMGIILIVAWMLIFSLAKDLLKVRKGFNRIDEAKARLVEEEQKNTLLKEKLSVVLTDEYKEKLIREQLNMQKIGEVVVVLPKKGRADKINEGSVNEEKSNLQKWFSLLK